MECKRSVELRNFSVFEFNLNATRVLVELCINILPSSVLHVLVFIEWQFIYAQRRRIVLFINTRVQVLFDI